MPEKVRIVNPVENGAPITSRKRALQFVEAGRAAFVGVDQLRFIDSDLRNQAAAKRAAQGYHVVARILTKEELRHIPMIQPAKAYRNVLVRRSRRTR